jgi:hypothetical protein
MFQGVDNIVGAPVAVNLNLLTGSKLRTEGILAGLLPGSGARLCAGGRFRPAL